MRPRGRKAIDKGAERASKAAASSAGESTKPVNKHIFESIAEMALTQVDKKKSSNISSSNTAISPFQLLYRLMSTRSRARIILRKAKGSVISTQQFE